MKIYTRKGDMGETSLIGGTRVPKNHIRVEAYGCVDELNAFIGMAMDHPLGEAQLTTLHKVQNRLFNIGSQLASDPEKSRMQLEQLKPADVELLESEIDRMESALEPLRNFILPGGHAAVSICHVCRCVCRRSERSVLSLAQQEPVPESIIAYLNRLSDYFFVLARHTAHSLGVTEHLWKSDS